MEPFEYKK